jgi:hypothetical protein
MDSLPLAMLLISRGRSDARSALPDAPVVPERPRHRSAAAARSRGALARGLYRVATALAPDADGATRATGRATTRATGRATSRPTAA